MSLKPDPNSDEWWNRDTLGTEVMPGSRGSEEAAKIGTLNTATRQLNLSSILYAVPCGPRPSSVAEWRLAVDVVFQL